MKAKLINGVTIFLFVFLANSAVAQDTYSIVAVDPETGESKILPERRTIIATERSQR